MSQDKLLTFIIPACNVAETIDNILNRIIKICHQRLTQIEILVVENGSTDQTLSRLEYWSRSFPELVRYLSVSKGVSIARNAGIVNSSGKWLAFIDADDDISPVQIDEFFSLLDTSMDDVYIFDFFKNQKRVSMNLKENLDETEITYLIEKPTLYMTVWNKLFSRNFLISQDIRFDERLRLAEDGDFMLAVLTKAQSIRYANLAYYIYQTHSSSTMGRLDTKSEDYRLAMQVASKKYEESQLIEIDSLDKYILSHLIIILVREIFNIKNQLSYRQRLNQLKDLLKEPIFKNSLGRIDVKQCLSVYYLVIILLKYHCYHIAGILCMMKSWYNYKQMD